MAMGNQVRGERHYAAKLSWAEVRVIRALFAADVPQAEIQRHCPKVSKVMIWKIVHNKSWKEEQE